MKCPKKEELTLFYYQELGREDMERIRRHLGECRSCRMRYEQMQSTLSELKTDPIHLESREVEDILQKVKVRLTQRRPKNYLQEKLESFAGSVRLGLGYRPQLIPVAVMLIAVFLILPFMARERRTLERDFAILQIEIELSLDNPEGSLFELYEEAEILHDDSSSIGQILGEA
jgi:hypothetical protein